MYDQGRECFQQIADVLKDKEIDTDVCWHTITVMFYQVTDVLQLVKPLENQGAMGQGRGQIVVLDGDGLLYYERSP